MTKKTALLSLFLFCITSTCSVHNQKKPVLEPVLDFPLKKTLELTFEGEINTSLVKSSERVYFTSSRGHLYCIDDPEDGLTLLYKSRVDFVSPPYIYGECIVICDSANNLYGISKIGNLKWKVGIDSRITSGIHVESNKIFFGTEKGMFLSYHMETGDHLWEVKTGEAAISLPIVINGTVVFGSEDRHLYFLNQNGTILDKIVLESKISSSFAYQNSRLYFGSEDQNFNCFHMERKKIQWKMDTGGQASAYPLVQGKYILFTSWNNVLFCLNNRNGTVLWWNQIPARSAFRMKRVGNKIMVTSFSPILNCFDINTGEEAGKYVFNTELKSNPEWFHDYVLVSAYDKEKDLSKVIFLKSSE
jgi:outer membrane protein assembly factor BamB